MLVAFGGLPATGKTTLAREVARRWPATWLRIDLIEQAVRSANVLAGDIGPAGYAAAYALAEANLKLGGAVVADCVNPLAVTRQAWRDVAGAAGTPILEVEIVCSDADEHRRRAEGRVSDIDGLVPPDWEAIRTRHYEPWPAPDLCIDTASCDVETAVAKLLDAMRRKAGG